jgi:hypothetical protein
MRPSCSLGVTYHLESGVVRFPIDCGRQNTDSVRCCELPFRSVGICYLHQPFATAERVHGPMGHLQSLHCNNLSNIQRRYDFLISKTQKRFKMDYNRCINLFMIKIIPGPTLGSKIVCCMPFQVQPTSIRIVGVREKANESLLLDTCSPSGIISEEHNERPRRMGSGWDSENLCARFILAAVDV